MLLFHSISEKFDVFSLVPFCSIKVILIVLKISLLLPELHISNSIKFPFSGLNQGLNWTNHRHENNLKHTVELKEGPVAMTMAPEFY